jgi:hypothetical protein
MPAQKPNRSEQTVGTPPAFVHAVVQRFGPIVRDLAATHENSLAARRSEFFGPGSKHAENALDDSVRWGLSDGGLAWLNPPFGRIKPWVEKCAAESANGARILLLVPASVGAEWFFFLREGAYVFELAPRLTFVGHATPYPKDLVLAYFGPERFTGRQHWRWR